MKGLSWLGNRCYRRPLIVTLVLGNVLAILLIYNRTGFASPPGGEAAILSPNWVGGATGRGDQRDIDIYPAVAYDPSTGRYLVVWSTARHAASSSAGLDVYGVFLNAKGRRIGNEFRVSDTNNAARNSPVMIAAGNGEFAVVWATRGVTCKLYTQKVTNSSARADQLLLSGSSHVHSPHLVYNAGRNRYAVVFVEGPDYLPPTFLGADTSDCGNNANSTSQIKAFEFFFRGENPHSATPVNVSSVNGGAFRPHLSFSAALNRYLVAWEDRHNSSGDPYRFDIYAQRLNNNLTPNGTNLVLVAGGNYTNGDNSSTWTPRPAVAAGSENFLVSWFSQQMQEGGVSTWSVNGQLVPGAGSQKGIFTVAQMTFTQHENQAPTGFLTAMHNNLAGEYLVGMTTHLESFWGYFSSALVQRVSSDGQLLNLDGSVRSQPGVGHSIDFELDDQVSLALAVNPVSGTNKTDYLAVYSKHAVNQHAQDFDIWGTRIQLRASTNDLFLPAIIK